jgi:diaminohydroxyphosphoribosylaminopyrimidine deaminase/5-amino-6-(5-phosphoribosylamino)uracil reductase
MLATEKDRTYMWRALELAQAGLYTTTPNPRVGCVLVRDGQIVGEGFHEKAGEAHAEVRALEAAGPLARGATAYVTLEPCCHQGRTPPCTDTLIGAGVVRVVAAMRDPNPVVSGRGFEVLENAGIGILSGVLENEARELNNGYLSRVVRGRPWVRVKVAASLDGRTALNNGQSQWITGQAARDDGHRWRALACAVLTGSGTVLADDPQLTVRALATPRQPLRIVLDTSGETPKTAKVFADGNVLLVYGHQRPFDLPSHVQTLAMPNAEGRVDLEGLMKALGRNGINEVQVEAGARLNAALLRAGLVDELLVYLAPTLVGDKGLGMFDLPELTSLSGATRIEIRDVRMVDRDVRIIARTAKHA